MSLVAIVMWAALGLVAGVVLCIALGLVLGIALHWHQRLRDALADDHRRRAEPLRYFYVLPGGVPHGPAALEQLRAMLADGRLRADALAAPAGSDEWQPVATVVGRAGVSRGR